MLGEDSCVLNAMILLQNPLISTANTKQHYLDSVIKNVLVRCGTLLGD